MSPQSVWAAVPSIMMYMAIQCNMKKRNHNSKGVKDRRLIIQTAIEVLDSHYPPNVSTILRLCRIMTILVTRTNT